MAAFTKYDRELLGDLSRYGYESLKEFFRVAVPNKEATPGAITAIQTFGEMLNFHPHLHCLVTDGCFGKEGTFYRLPSLVDMDLLTDLFRHKVLRMLLSQGKVTEALEGSGERLTSCGLRSLRRRWFTWGRKERSSTLRQEGRREEGL